MSTPYVDTLDDVQPIVRDHEQRIAKLESIARPGTLEHIELSQAATRLLAPLAKPNETTMDTLLRVLTEREQLIAKAAR